MRSKQSRMLSPHMEGSYSRFPRTVMDFMKMNNKY
jgi:hypothetical protein